MIKCIAIDDEPIALKQIVDYIEKTPFLEFSAGFESTIEALSFLEKNEVDLMFVDIQMPDLNGIELVKSLSKPPAVIFITASKNYALEGFQVNALDYLLKPIDYATFYKSAAKTRTQFELLGKNSEEIKSNNDYLFLKSDYKIIRIEIDKILYIEGMREYVRIFLENKSPVISLLSLKNIEQRLPSIKFMRVHRSYIVNLEKITIIERNRIVFNKTYIPVSEQYKDTFQKYIDNNFL